MARPTPEERRERDERRKRNEAERAARESRERQTYDKVRPGGRHSKTLGTFLPLTFHEAVARKPDGWPGLRWVSEL